MIPKPCIDADCMNQAPNHSHGTLDSTYTRYPKNNATDGLTPAQFKAANSMEVVNPQSSYMLRKDIQQLKDTGYKLEYYEDIVWASKDPRRSGPTWSI